MNYRHIEVFFAVMTCGTVTEAARMLGVSQPSVTTTLKQAEARLGILLFQRDGGRLTPTEEAHLLFEEAARAHEALSAFQSLARRLQIGHGGQVRVAAIPSLSLELLPDAISDFHAHHAGFHFHVSTLNTEEIIDELQQRGSAFHLGLSLGLPVDTQVPHEVVAETEVYAAVPQSWKIKRRNSIRLVELAARPYIAAHDGTALARLARTLFQEAEMEPDVVAHIHTHHLAGRLVQRGLGYTLLDSITVHALSSDRLSEAMVILPLHSRPSLPVVALFPPRGALNNAARLFLDGLGALCRQREEIRPAL